MLVLIIIKSHNTISQLRLRKVRATTLDCRSVRIFSNVSKEVRFDPFTFSHSKSLWTSSIMTKLHQTSRKQCPDMSKPFQKNPFFLQLTLSWYFGIPHTPVCSSMVKKSPVPQYQTNVAIASLARILMTSIAVVFISVLHLNAVIIKHDPRINRVQPQLNFTKYRFKALF